MAIQQQQLISPVAPTWCPGCGNFSILTALKQALMQLELDYQDVVLVFGIGCSGNMADFIKVNGFHALHGRAIANAIGIKLANHKLKVIVAAGDGDLYGEGLNHLIAAARGNHDLTVLVHNNQRYSLTTGQVSPASDKGTKGKSTPDGVIEEAINPLALAIAADAGFVARTFAGQVKVTAELISQAIQYPGFSLVDILQPCPTFNKQHDYKWYMEHTQALPKDHQSTDQQQALLAAMQEDVLGLGLFYKSPRPAYHQQLANLQDQSLIEQFPKTLDLKQAMLAMI